MSRLLLASIAVLTALCGLVFAVGFLILLRMHLPPNLVLPCCGGFAVIVVLAQYLLGPTFIDQIISIRWTSPAELGPDFDRWLSSTCSTFKIPTPRFGIIEEGSPNAFTYGNGPWNARVVVTRGVIDALDPEELKAVVAHELGHIKHRDFIVMTVVQALVLALYALYIASRFGNRRSGWYVVILSFVAYQLSYYISLFLSRVREYMADYASAQIMATGNPLSSALVKIAYGMGRFNPSPATGGGYRVPAGQPTPPPARPPANASPYAVAPPTLSAPPVNYGSDRMTPELMAKLNQIQAESNRKNAVVSPALLAPQGKPAFSAQSLGAFGISGIASMRSAVTWQGADGAIDPDHFTAGARWELFNPWAKFAEVLSTHPLTVRRIQALQSMNARWGVASKYDFTKIKKEKYTGFLRDLLVVCMPTVLALGTGFGVYVMYPGAEFRTTASWMLGLAGLFGGNFAQLLFKYKGGFLRSRIVNCISELNVSHVNPKPVVLQGVFTGHVSAGVPWARDFILQDDSGFVACVIHQPLMFLEFIWGYMYSKQFIGQEVIVHGWYRRFGAPVVEISHFEVPALRKGVRSYYFAAALATTTILTIACASLGSLMLR